MEKPIFLYLSLPLEDANSLPKRQALKLFLEQFPRSPEGCPIVIGFEDTKDENSVFHGVRLGETYNLTQPKEVLKGLTDLGINARLVLQE